jgi:hypothetical protein
MLTWLFSAFFMFFCKKKIVSTLMLILGFRYQYFIVAAAVLAVNTAFIGIVFALSHNINLRDHLHFASLETVRQYLTRFCRVPKNNMSFISHFWRQSYRAENGYCRKIGPIYARFCQFAY